jgi:hypothetical protein
MIEHGKKFQWEYCRDFVPMVVLPDYKELMRSVRADHLLERKKAKEKKEKEKKQRQKERAEKEDLRKKKHRARLRRRRERLKEKLLREKLKAEKAATAGKKKLGLEDSENGVVGKRDRVSSKSSDVPDN